MKLVQVKQELKDAGEALSKAEAALGKYSGKGKPHADYHGRLAQAAQAIQRAIKFRGEDDVPAKEDDAKSAKKTPVRHATSHAPIGKPEEGKVFP